jgi:hypothetical protein
MVICIEEFLQKVQQHAFLATEVAVSPARSSPQPEDQGPDDDPPSWMRIAA